MRKNKDWYEDDDVLSFIKYLIVKYSPAIMKDVITAFKEFIEKFEKLELIWYEWQAIYKAGKSPEEITNDILYPVDGNNAFRLFESPEHKVFKTYTRKKGRNNKSLLRA